MRTIGIVRTTLILTIMGTLVSVQQVSSESVFTAKEAVKLENLRVKPLTLTDAASPAPVVSRSFSALRGDTTEANVLEVEEEEGPGIAKEIAMYAIIAAAVTFAVIELIKPGETEKKPTTGGGGKEPPAFSRSAFVSVPLTHSR